MIWSPSSPSHDDVMPEQGEKLIPPCLGRVVDCLLLPPPRLSGILQGHLQALCLHAFADAFLDT